MHLIQSEIRRKETDKVTILRLQIKDNITAEEKLCAIVGDYGVSQALINNLQHESFAKVNVDILVSFILARRDDVPKSKLPNKGKIADAIRGEINLISMAFNFRTKPNLLLSKLSVAEEAERDVGLEVEQSNFTRHEVIVQLLNDSVKASTYLNDEVWLARAKLIFANSSTALVNYVTIQLDCDKSDLLQKFLKSRLTNHVKRRIKDKKKMDNWSIY